MTQELIVAVDGSPSSWRAFDVALGLAQRLDVAIRLVEIAADPVDGRFTAQRLDRELVERGPVDVEVVIDVRLQVETVADELAHTVATHPGSVVVMASHGRGRSAAVLGSVADALIRRTVGPIVVVGPEVDASAPPTGPVVVTIDGSDESQVALPLAATWGAALGATPWVVHAARPADSDLLAGLAGEDLVDSGEAARLARHLSSLTGSDVEFEVLHDVDPVRSVTQFARSCGASLIVASSHGRSGFSRLAVGSVTAGFVRHAPCPVVVVRPSRPRQLVSQSIPTTRP